ncbi:MAG: AsmA family protein [Desulfuromonadaceae bacterium]|nr:AsmA family protein [Desulfuromonadaceae bacterium]
MKIAALRHMRVVRLLAIMLLVAIFVLCSAVIALYFFATPDKIRAALIPVIEEQLEFDVEFSGIDVNLFSGVRITGLNLAEKDEELPWLQVDEAVLRYRFLPLLQGRLVIDELRLNSPTVVVQRNADGTVTMGNVAGKAQNTSGSIFPFEAAQEGEQVNFHISTITVTNAEVMLRDFVFSTIPRLTRLQDVGLQLHNFSAESDWRFALWGKLNGSPLDVEGVYDPRSERGSLKLVLEGLDLVAFRPYYREQLPFKINRLGVSTQCQVQFDPAGFNLEGDVRLAGVDISDIDSFASRNDVFSAQQLSANLHLKWEHNSRQLKLLRTDARMDGLRFGARGTASFGAERQEYNIDLELRQWPIRAMAEYAALLWLDNLEEYAPAGTCSAIFVWRKDAKDNHGSVRAGKLTLVDAGLSAGGIRFGLNGEIELNGDSLNSSALNAKIGGENIRAALFCENWRALRPRFKLRFKGAKFDTWNLLASTRMRADARSPMQGDQRAVARVASEPGPYAIPFDIDAEFDVDSVTWRSATLQQVKGSFSIDNNKLTLEGMNGTFASGVLNVNANVDLGQQGFSYTANFEGKQLRMKQMLTALWPGFSGTITGRTQLNAQISGAGTQQLRVRQNLSGNIHLGVEDGSVSGVNALHVLAQQLNIPSVTKLNFIAASAEFQLQAGNTPRFALLGRNERLRVSVQGRADWQGQTEGQLTLHIFPSLAEGINPEFAHSATIDVNGWSVVDSDVSGSVRQPDFSPISGRF